MINLLAIPYLEIQIILLLYFILIEITAIYCLETNHEHIATSLKLTFMQLIVISAHFYCKNLPGARDGFKRKDLFTAEVYFSDQSCLHFQYNLTTYKFYKLYN